MTYPVTYVEPTTVLRDWLRTVTAVTDVVSTRVYAGGLPADATLPAIVVTRIAGGLDGAVDLGVYDFDCWGSTHPAAATVANALVGVLATLSGTQPLSSTVRATGGTVQAVLPQPDLDDPTLYRIVVTAQVTTIHTP